MARDLQAKIKAKADALVTKSEVTKTVTTEQAVTDILLVAAAFWGHGRYQRIQGASQERAKIEREQIAIDLGQQVEKARADAIYRGQILASRAAAKKWLLSLMLLGRMLQSLREQLQVAGTCSGLNIDFT